MIPSLSRSHPRLCPWCAAPLLLLLWTACQPSPRALEAERLLLRRDYAAAQDRVDAGLRETPRSRPLWEVAIRIHLAQDQVHLAAQRYRRYSEHHGPDTRLLRHLALSVLRWGLGHRDPAVRLAALQGARKTDDPALEQDVAARLQDPDAVVRTWAAIALSGSPRGADTLGEQLRSSHTEARAVAVRALGRLAREAALPALLPVLEDRAPTVRMALADALGLTRTSDALAPLVKLLGDKDKGVRTRAAAAIGSLGAAAGVKPLKRALGDHHLGVRLAALLALSLIDPVGSKPQLRRVAGGEELLTALRAGVALAKLGEDQPVLDSIAKGLVDRRAALRAAGCNAASSVKSRVAARLVKRALRDPQPEVRMAAARAMISHGKKDSAVRTALALQRETCGAVTPDQQRLCLQAAELLAGAGHPTGMRLLGQLISKGLEPQLRLQALTIALQRGGDQQVALDALRDRAPMVPLAAAAWITVRTR